MALSKSFLQAAKKAMFNPSEWTPVGEPVSLKEIWDTMSPGMYKSIDGNVAEVTIVTFKDGSEALRISIPMKDGEAIELPLSGQSDLVEGDEIAIDSIFGQELKKAGRDNIVRYDGQLYEPDDEEDEEEEETPAPKKRTRSKK